MILDFSWKKREKFFSDKEEIFFWKQTFWFISENIKY